MPDAGSRRLNRRREQAPIPRSRRAATGGRRGRGWHQPVGNRWSWCPLLRASCDKSYRSPTSIAPFPDTIYVIEKNSNKDARVKPLHPLFPVKSELLIK